MDTDLDPDDTIGRRLSALRTWEPPASAADAWRHIERRRRRPHARGASRPRRSSWWSAPSRRAPSIAAPRPEHRRETFLGLTRWSHGFCTCSEPAETGRLTVAPAGPIAAGAVLEVRFTEFSLEVGDTFNTSMSVCFRWADGDPCNPSVDARFLGANGVPTYRLSLPGWVYTAAGLRSCQAIGCRLEMTADGGMGRHCAAGDRLRAEARRARTHLRVRYRRTRA